MFVIRPRMLIINLPIRLISKTFRASLDARYGFLLIGKTREKGPTIPQGLSFISIRSEETLSRETSGPCMRAEYRSKITRQLYRIEDRVVFGPHRELFVENLSRRCHPFVPSTVLGFIRGSVNGDTNARRIPYRSLYPSICISPHSINERGASRTR